MPHATCPEREQVKVANRWIAMSLVVTAAAMIGYGTIQRDRDAAQEARQAEMDTIVAQMRDDLSKLTDLTETNAAQVFEVQEKSPARPEAGRRQPAQQQRIPHQGVGSH